MLNAAGCRRRIARLWAAVPERVQWLLIADPRHVTYLSAFSVNPFSWAHGERVLLYLDRGGPTLLLGDNLTVTAAAEDFFVDDIITEPFYDHCHSMIYRDQVLWLRQVQLDVEKRYGRRITGNAMVQLAVDWLATDYRKNRSHSRLIRELVLQTHGGVHPFGTKGSP